VEPFEEKTDRRKGVFYRREWVDLEIIDGGAEGCRGNETRHSKKKPAHAGNAGTVNPAKHTAKPLL